MRGAGHPVNTAAGAQWPHARRAIEPPRPLMAPSRCRRQTQTQFRDDPVTHQAQQQPRVCPVWPVPDRQAPTRTHTTQRSPTRQIGEEKSAHAWRRDYPSSFLRPTNATRRFPPSPRASQDLDIVCALGSVAKLADAQVLEACGLHPCGFKSLRSHQRPVHPCTRAPFPIESFPDED